jgi:hypothetical protein
VNQKTLKRRTLLASLCAAPAVWARPETGEPIALPARLNDYGQLLVPVRVNGSRPLWCELDSGGGGALMFLDLATAAGIGVAPTTLGRSTGATDPAASVDGRAQVDLAFPGLEIPSQELVIKPKPLPGDKEGVIGLMLLGKYVVELDHASPAVRLHNAEKFRYSGPGQAIPFTIENQNPYVTVSLTLRSGDEIRGHFVIDTGAAGSIAYLAKSFADRIRLLARVVKSAPDSLGLTACRIERLSLGPFSVERPIIDQFAAMGFGGSAEPSGMLGIDFLRRFKIFMDWGRKQITLEPNRYYREPSRFDASGIRVYRLAGEHQAVQIFQVLPGTPAAEAGLREGDNLIALDDVPVERMSPGMVHETLREDGREITLLVQRQTEVFTLKLRLRKLL